MIEAPSPATSRAADSEAPQRLGWFIGGTVVSTWIYGALTTYSAGRCVGGPTVSESPDAWSTPEATAPLCASITAGPSTVVYAIVAAITIVALVLARRLRHRPVPQNRMLGAAMSATALVCFVSLILARMWIGSIDMDDWDGSTTFDVSVPAIVVDVSVEITPMQPSN
ncbi:hypothetical protein [Demequina aestuarii]|uniref:hypothetical protein n=1 Tax=Demequina aestuarii TaxID=327095 RepID=UPI0007847C69|nr:hypothetical protein [Demequina aestuarii]